MDFEQFKENLTKDVKACFDDRTGADSSVETHKVDKMNYSYEAMVVKPEGSDVGVSIDVNNLYETYQNGTSYEQIVAGATESAEHYLNDKPDFNIDALKDYSRMKDKLSMDVVSSERNAELLEKVPHKNIEDMAVVYRFVLDDVKGSVLVTNQMLENYNVTPEQLHADAMEVAPEIRPAVIKGMSEVLAESLGVEQAEMLGIGPVADEPIFVASVEDNIRGAGILAYQDFMDQAADRLGGSFYILPSSVHEILLVKDNGQFNKDSLEKMVVEVNATTVKPEDKLTDSVYHYDSKEKVFEMAEKFENRVREAKEAAPKEKASLVAEISAKKKEIAAAPKKDAPVPLPKTKGGEAK